MTTELYDVDAALRQLAASRRLRDPLTRATAQLADDLAHHMSANFGPEELETVGRALIIVAASLGVLPHEQPEIQAAVLVNVAAFAGQRLVIDGREADKAAMR